MTDDRPMPTRSVLPRTFSNSASPPKMMNEAPIRPHQRPTDGASSRTTDGGASLSQRRGGPFSSFSVMAFDMMHYPSERKTPGLSPPARRWESRLDRLGRGRGGRDGSGH